MRKIKFKAKLENGNWENVTNCFRHSHFLYYNQEHIHGYSVKINHSTLCQLITKIGDVEIYEYDCYYINNIITYFYYDLRGKLYYIQREKVNNVNHITDYFMDEQYLLEDIISKAKFIGNWHDGEQFLLDKIKELEE